MVPRWQLASLTRYLGRLVVEEKHLPDLGRHSTIARIISDNREDQDWPVLYDVRLLATTSQWLTMTGFEIDTTDSGREVHYMQTWLLTPKPDPNPK